MIDYFGNKISWVPAILDDKKPKYMAIAESIETDIQTGRLLHGEMMPPQRLIANYLNINHGTVTRAYKICEEKGLIKGIVGKGTFVSGSAGLPVSMLTDHEDSDIINLGMSLPLYESNGIIQDHVQAVLSDIDYNIALKYCPPEGFLKHRYIEANWLKKRKINCDPKNIILTSGTQNALAVILLSLFSKSDRIAVDEFTYTGLKSLAKYLGIILIPVAGDSEGMSPDELEKTCKRDKIKGIYMMPDCHNPYSICINKKRRMHLAQVIEKHNLLLIEDAAFGFTVEQTLEPISSYIPQNSFYIHGTSKEISPSFRISYIVSPSQYFSQLQLALNNITWMSSPYTAEVLSLLQSTKRYDAIIDAKLKILKQRNILFEREFSSYNSIGSKYSMFRVIELPEGWECRAFEEFALSHGIQVFSASRFSVGTHNKHNLIRISISSPKNIQELEKGLKMIKSMLASSPSASLPII
ncbi:MAG: PLP-dependent aminotransferase family protein [Eubacteriales bacterium]